jgi:quercetin dioxygenase-like cupin family protein
VKSIPKRPSKTPDDVFLFIYEKGQARAKDLENAFVKTKHMSRGTLYKYRRQLENVGKIQSTPVNTRPPHYVYYVPDKYHQGAELIKQYRIFPQSTYTNFARIPWSNPPAGFYLTHVREKILWQNAHTGAMMILAETPIGLVTPGHYHPNANQWVIGFYGEIEDSNGERQNIHQTLSFIPKGELHGTGRVTKKTLALVYFDGARTKKFVRQQNKSE